MLYSWREKGWIVRKLAHFHAFSHPTRFPAPGNLASGAKLIARQSNDEPCPCRSRSTAHADERFSLPLQQSSLFLPSFTARQSFSRLQVFKAVQGCSMDCALAPCDLFRQQATGTGSSAKVPKFPCQKCTFSILRARHDMMTYAGTK